MIKLFISDIDGTLTDSTCLYTEKGELGKFFSHRDGRGFHLLHHNTAVKTGMITSEYGGINAARAGKLLKLGTLDYFLDSNNYKNKLHALEYICNEMKITFDEVAFIGDDTNDSNVLEVVGVRACPNDAHKDVKKIPGILIMENNGGKGAVREFIDYLIGQGKCELK